MSRKFVLINCLILGISASALVACLGCFLPETIFGPCVVHLRNDGDKSISEIALTMANEQGQSKRLMYLSLDPADRRSGEMRGNDVIVEIESITINGKFVSFENSILVTQSDHLTIAISNDGGLEYIWGKEKTEKGQGPDRTEIANE